MFEKVRRVVQRGCILTMPEVGAAIAWENALKNPIRVRRVSSGFRLAIAVPGTMLAESPGTFLSVRFAPDRRLARCRGAARPLPAALAAIAAVAFRVPGQGVDRELNAGPPR